MQVLPIGETDSIEVRFSFRCCKISLTGQIMVSLPIAYSTAIYGLQELAHIEEGEVYVQHHSFILG